MSYTINAQANIQNVIFYDASAGTYTNRTLAGDDLFPDTAAAGDRLYFGAALSTTTTNAFFEMLDLSIDVAVAADAISFKYYYSTREVAFREITSYINSDGTTGLTTSGEIDFHSADCGDVQVATVNSVADKYWFVIEIASVTNITEGGSYDATPECRDGTIKVDTETTSAFDIYTEAEAAGYGHLFERLEVSDGQNVSEMYKTSNHIYLVNSTWTDVSSFVHIEVGKQTWGTQYWLYGDSDSHLTWGTWNTTYKLVTTRVMISTILNHDNGAYTYMEVGGSCTLNGLVFQGTNCGISLSNASNVFRNCTIQTGPNFSISASATIEGNKFRLKPKAQYFWGTLPNDTFIENTYMYGYYYAYLAGSANEDSGFKGMMFFNSRFSLYASNNDGLLVNCAWDSTTSFGAHSGSQSAKWHIGRDLILKLARKLREDVEELRK